MSEPHNPYSPPSAVVADESAGAVREGAYSYAQGRFRKIVEGHVASGGEIHSWWRVVGISLLVVLVTIVIAAGVVFGLAAMGFMPE
jgi:hypothetical protein